MDHLKTGEVISKRRRELGLTQNQLAKSLNISFQAVSKWENSTAYPDIEMLPRLAAVFAGLPQYFTAASDTVGWYQYHLRTSKPAKDTA